MAIIKNGINISLAVVGGGVMTCEEEQHSSVLFSDVQCKLTYYITDFRLCLSYAYQYTNE